MSIVGTIVPNFISSAILPSGKIIEDFNLKNYLNNKHKALIFFWPQDFTFVCPTEIIAFNKRLKEFNSRNTKIIGISCDSVYVHNKWRNTEINKGGIGKIDYVMVSDFKKDIQKIYQVEHKELKVALRATFIIDENYIVRYQSINDLPIGRNINEYLRTLDALEFHKKSGKVCPAQWTKEKEGIVPNEEGIINYLTNNHDKL